MKHSIYRPPLSVILHSRPYLKILGCQTGWDIDNLDPTPRETVIIKFGSLPRFEAAAEFYAYLAYPDNRDARRRENYRVALSRWAVLERAEVDKEWKESTKLDRSIRPLIFCQTEKFFQQEYQRGTKKWWDRAIVSSTMLLPHLHNLGGLPPQVQNIALLVAGELGYKSTSTKTLEADIWAPAKPVAHALTAVMVAFQRMRNPDEEQKQKYPLCYKDPSYATSFLPALLASLFYEDMFVKEILMLAELLRLQLPSCKRFKIRADQLIRFVDPLWL